MKVPPFIVEVSRAGQDRGAYLREGSSWPLAPSLPSLVPQASLAQWHQSDSLALTCPQSLSPDPRAEAAGCVATPSPPGGLLEHQPDDWGLLSTLPALQRQVLGVTGWV